MTRREGSAATALMRLEIRAGGARGTSFELDEDQEVLIGRGEDTHIRLQDPKCSRHHARVRIGSDGITIEDLGSRNGIFVNGVRCRQSALQQGDEVLLGDTLLRLGEGEPKGLGTTQVNLRDGEDSVVVSLRHDEADLLGRASSPRPSLEAEEERRLLRHLCEITQDVATSHDMDGILVAILDRMQDILGADAACVLMRDPGGEWTLRAASTSTARSPGITVSRTIAREAVGEGKAILSTDPLHDGRFGGSDSIIVQQLASAMCAPLKVNNAFVGVLFLDRRGSRAAFTALDLRFAATVGNLLGVLFEKEQWQTAALQRERLAAIGEVVAGLAHCIKNIVTGLKFSVGTLECILERQAYGDAGRCVESIRAQEQRISNLVLNMLSYAKERKPERSAVDVKALAGRVSEPYVADMAKSGIDFQLAVPSECPRIWADESAMERVFLNLLVNAIDAVREKQDGAERQIRVSAEPSAEAVDICLRDTGIGIPPAKRGKIFDAFFSTKGGSGTGLGLAVVRKIVEEHGGEVAVDSREDEWTEFRLTLPAARGATAPEG